MLAWAQVPLVASRGSGHGRGPLGRQLEEWAAVFITCVITGGDEGTLTESQHVNLAAVVFAGASGGTSASMPQRC